METRSKTRAGQAQASAMCVLEGPVSRSPTEVDEDWGLATLLGDREIPAVGGGRPGISATTSLPEDNPVVSEWVPARERVIESADALFRIAILSSHRVRQTFVVFLH